MRSSLAVVTVALAALSGCGPPAGWESSSAMRYELSGSNCAYAADVTIVRERTSQEVVALVYSRDVRTVLQGGGGGRGVRLARLECGVGEPDHMTFDVVEEYESGETRRSFLVNRRPIDIAAHNVVVQGLDGEPRLLHLDLSTFDDLAVWGHVAPESHALRCELEQAVFDTWGEIRLELGADSEVYATLEEYRAKYHSKSR